MTKAADRPAAVVIRGNPKFTAGNPAAAEFYSALAKVLAAQGYAVSEDAGEPYTVPAGDAAVWVGHSRGADRLRFAPPGVRTVAVGSNRPGAVNHPADDVNLWPGEEPPPAHFDLTPDMAARLARLVGRAGREKRAMSFFCETCGAGRKFLDAGKCDCGGDLVPDTEANRKTYSKAAAHYRLTGDVQGVGLRETLHTLLAERGLPGLAYNDGLTGHTYAHIPAPKRTREEVLAALLDRLRADPENSPDLAFAARPTRRREPLEKVVVDAAGRARFAKAHGWEDRFGAAPAAVQIKTLADRYRLADDGTGVLTGEVPATAARQLRGEEPVHHQPGRTKAARWGGLLRTVGRGLGGGLRATGTGLKAVGNAGYQGVNLLGQAGVTGAKAVGQAGLAGAKAGWEGTKAVARAGHAGAKGLGWYAGQMTGKSPADLMTRPVGTVLGGAKNFLTTPFFAPFTRQAFPAATKWVGRGLTAATLAPSAVSIGMTPFRVRDDLTTAVHREGVNRGLSPAGADAVADKFRSRFFTDTLPAALPPWLGGDRGPEADAARAAVGRVFTPYARSGLHQTNTHGPGFLPGRWRAAAGDVIRGVRHLSPYGIVTNEVMDAAGRPLDPAVPAAAFAAAKPHLDKADVGGLAAGRVPADPTRLQYLAADMAAAVPPDDRSRMVGRAVQDKMKKLTGAWDRAADFYR